MTKSVLSHTSRACWFIFPFLPGSTKGTWIMVMEESRKCCPRSVAGILKPSSGVRVSWVYQASSLSPVWLVPPHTCSLSPIYGDFLIWFVLPSSVLSMAGQFFLIQVQPKGLCQFRTANRGSTESGFRAIQGEPPRGLALLIPSKMFHPGLDI